MRIFTHVQPDSLIKQFSPEANFCPIHHLAFAETFHPPHIASHKSPKLSHPFWESYLPRVPNLNRPTPFANPIWVRIGNIHDHQHNPQKVVFQR